MPEVAGPVVAEETPTGWYVDHPFGHDGPLPENMARSRAVAYSLKYDTNMRIDRLPLTHPARSFDFALASDGGRPGGEV
jgi:hypothetical protein